MKHSYPFAFFVGLATSISNIGWAADALDERAASSRAVIKAFAGDLQKELKTALQDQGPAYAISVCQAVAPEIANRRSDETGWTVGRTSLKLRNPGNEPDAWERVVLEGFEERKANGEDVQHLEYAEVVEGEDGHVFRYMKAIPTGDVCLTCHGSAIPYTVDVKLADLYPDDKARGFSVGDIRGAFTIKQPVD